MRTVILRRGLVALFAAAVTFGAITQAQALSSHEGVLRIGYQKYGTLVLLKAKGTLEKRLAAQGVDVQWTEFPGGPQLLEGLNVGSIDFGVTGETPPVFAQAAGADLLYVAYEPPAPHSEAILVPKDSPIKTVQGLKGKKVVLNKGSNVHYLLVRALEDAGLKYTDIQTVFLPPADARAAFERGSVDAWVIWDPYQAAAEQQLQARTLRDGQGIVDNHQFYLATKPYAQKNPEVIKTLVEEVRAVGEWSKANPEDVTKQVSPLLGLPADITLISMKRQGYGALFLTPEVVAAQQKIADSFYQLKLIPKQLSIKDVIWTPPAAVAEKIEQVRAKAAKLDRTVRFGIRLHVIVRETNAEAWQAADRLISHLDDETIARAQASLARFDSVGQQRMAALHGGSRDNLEVSPNLWAGVDLVRRGGAGTALVGDGPTVAARVKEYTDLGIDTFIFAGYPNLEESYRVAQLLFPHLDIERPQLPQGANYVSPFGEMVANDILPKAASRS